MSMPKNRYFRPQDADLARFVDGLDDDAREFFEERAAILEYDGGYSRAEGEQLAWKETQRYLLRRTGTGGKR